MGRIDRLIKILIVAMPFGMTACTDISPCTADKAIINMKELISEEEPGIDHATWDFRVEDEVEQYEVFARAQGSADPDYAMVGRVSKDSCVARIESF